MGLFGPQGNLPLMLLYAPLPFNAHQVQMNCYSLFLLLFGSSYCKCKGKEKKKQGKQERPNSLAIKVTKQFLFFF